MWLVERESVILDCDCGLLWVPPNQKREHLQTEVLSFLSVPGFCLFTFIDKGTNLCTPDPNANAHSLTTSVADRLENKCTYREYIPEFLFLATRFFLIECPDL